MLINVLGGRGGDNSLANDMRFGEESLRTPFLSPTIVSSVYIFNRPTEFTTADWSIRRFVLIGQSVE